MASGIKFDMTLFRTGLDGKLRVTKKTNAEVLNQAGGSICANAIRLTPKADAAKIKAELTSGGLALRLLQSSAMQSRLPKRLQGFTRGKYTRAQLDAATALLVKLRTSSRGYIAAGWFKALAVFRPGSRRKVSDKGLAGQGRATKATESSLAATFENHNRGAATIGVAPLQQAMDEEGSSMLVYWQKKMQQAWR